MAAPVDETRAGTNITSAASTWNINMPASVSAGDLLVCFVRAAGGAAINGGDLVTSWTDMTGSFANDASDDRTVVYAKVSDGSEGATDTLTFAVTVKGSAICWRVTGYSSIADIAGRTEEVFTTSNFNPASITLDASADWLVILCIGADGELITYTAPTNYGNLIQANSGTAAGAASNNCIGGSSRQLTAAASEDPGAWTHAAPANGGTAVSLGIKGVAAASPSLVLPNRYKAPIVRR